MLIHPAKVIVLQNFSEIKRVTTDIAIFWTIRRGMGRMQFDFENDTEHGSCLQYVYLHIDNLKFGNYKQVINYYPRLAIAVYNPFVSYAHVMLNAI